MGQMTETQNVATYSRIRPYNPAINEAKELTCRAEGDNKILNQNGSRVDSYNFTKVYGASSSTNDLFETAMKPLMDHKILKGITSIFIVYGQSGSGKSFTLIGEPGHLGLFPMSLQYLLDQESVQKIDIMAIECYGIKAAKIGFYDLVNQLKEKEKNPKKYDAYACKDNNRLNTKNAQMINVTKENCLKLITNLQEVSHMAPTLKNPHSSRGHTCYFTRIKLKGLEDVYLINIDLAGSEGQTALGTKDEFTSGLKLAMSKGKLHLSKKQQKGIEEMYKTRSLEAGCINNGLTQLQSIFGELIKKKISKSMGLGLRKVLSSFISLNSAYAILFTLSASANNNKVTRATLNFAKQTQLVKVDTTAAKKKIDKDAIIAELNKLIEELRKEMKGKNDKINELKKEIADGADTDKNIENEHKDQEKVSVFDKFDELNLKISEAQKEEKKWSVNVEHVQSGKMSDDEMKSVFDEFDEDGGGSIDAQELQNAMKKMGQTLSMDEVNDLILEIDANGDGEVDFDEFKVMATKGWFVKAFESKLVESLQKSMAKYIEADDDDKEDENAIDEEEVVENENDNNSLQQTQKIEELEQEIKSLKGEKEKKQNEEIERLQNEIKDLMNKHLEQNKIYQKQIEENQQKLKEMQTENNELKTNVSTLSNEKSEMTLQIEELKAKLSENENQNDIESKLKEYEVKNENLVKENDGLKQQLKSLQIQKDELMQNAKISQTQSDEMKIDQNDANIDNPQQPNSVIYDLMRKVLEGLV